MKILFAVSNENIAEAVKREYQNNYKTQLITKNVYYFNAIIKELQNNKTYDVVIISEDLEPFANNNYDIIDKFLSDKLKTIREEAVNAEGIRVPIVFITTDRHILGDFLTSKLYEIGIYNALVGNDRSIENVCTLMFHPRKKHEARAYYRVNAEVDNTPKEDDVKEEEIKNIILHYKKLGKAEEKYVDSFDNIASQYTDAQLKVIIRFLPLNVKAVLEAQSPKYQSLTTFANNYSTGAVTAVPQTEKQDKIREKDVAVDMSNGRVLEQISSVKDSSNVVIPNAMNVNRVRKIETGDYGESDEEPTFMSDRRKDDKNVQNEPAIMSLPGFEDLTNTENNNVEVEEAVLPGVESVEEIDSILLGFEEIEEDVEEQEEPVVKKGRGRPRKNPVTPVVSEGPKRGRGRPRKVQVIESEMEPDIEQEVEESVIESVNAKNTTLPGFEGVEQTLPGVEENTSVLPGFDLEDVISEKENDDTVLPGFEEVSTEQNNFVDTVEEDNSMKAAYINPVESIQKTNIVSEHESVRYENIEYLIPADKRIASFIGTSKAGVSFIVNNLAQMLSSFNINVAILDMTTNKNSFYIYTNNNESLRNKAENSIYNLLDGVSDGIKVNKNLTLYTALPTDTEKFYEADKVIKTLMDNHSVILIDCDYETPIGYFDNSTDVFMVQNMDILTMQPLTTFLKELKAKNVLKDEKLKFIVNMETRVKGINAQILLNAISVYKDPGMAYTVDLFDRSAVKVFTIPFDIEAYNKYLTSLVECNVSLTGYSKSMMTSLKEIASCIYPLLSTDKKNSKNAGYVPPSLDKYASTPFNSNMDSTLNQMKNRY